MELLYTDTLEEAREKLKKETRGFELRTQWTDLEESLGRICAGDVRAREDIPAFRRSTVDGYAIIAGDSYGSGDANPAFYQVTGHVAIEAETAVRLNPGEAVQVQTGSMVPENGTAVLMVEYTESYGTDKIAGYKAVSEGENLVQIGEDIGKDSILIRRGKVIDAGDIGVLAAQGIRSVEVYAPLKITIFSTGDELADLEEPLTGSRIRDINTYALGAAARSLGMEVEKQLRLKDDEEAIFQALSEAVSESDVVLLSGGSSKGEKDYTKKVLERLTGNVFTHGISIKPGKPTILAWNRPTETVIAGLPGHPMAALLMFQLLIRHWYEELTGMEGPKPYFARMDENVSSNQGRETCLLVRLKAEAGDYRALPVYAKSGSISSLTKADGYVRILRNREGLEKNERVRVEVFR